MSPAVLTEKKPKEGEEDLNPKKRHHRALKTVLKKELAVECIKPKSTTRSIPSIHNSVSKRPKFLSINAQTRAAQALIPIKIDYSKYMYAPSRVIVGLYARLGLHRFNFLEGKDLRVSSITEFTKTIFAAASTYVITFKAKDPSDAETLFQAQVSELTYGGFVLASANSGPHPVETKAFHADESTVWCGNIIMPTLPPEENPFQDDTGRFRLLKKSEVLKNEWIHLYLELAVATTNRQHIKQGVANLKILKVAMQITRDLVPFHRGLGAYDAIFYIRYKDTCQARAGDGVERVALVRRIVDVHSGIFRIIGRTQSFQTITPPASDGIAVMEASAQD